MLNSIEEFLNHSGELIRLIHDSTSGKYFSQNLTEAGESNDNLFLQEITNPKDAIFMLKNEKAVLVQKHALIRPVCKMTEPEGVINRGREFNIFVPNRYSKLFFDPTLEEAYPCEFVKTLDKLIKDPQERHKFFTTICHYLESGEPVSKPIKVSDGRGRLLFITSILAKIVGSHFCLSYDKEHCLSVIHTTRLPGRANTVKKGLIVQDLLNRDISKTAGLQIALSDHIETLSSLDNYVLTSANVPQGADNATIEELVEGIRYLKSYKGNRVYTGPVDKLQSAPANSEEGMLRILLDENWEELEKLFILCKIKNYAAGWDKGGLSKTALTQLLLKRFSSAVKKRVIMEFLYDIMTKNSKWEFHTGGVACFGPFDSLWKHNAKREAKLKARL